MHTRRNSRLVTKPKVALLLETSRGFGRQLLAGIAKYSHLRGPWSLYISPGDFIQDVPHMKEWGGQGIIARVANQKVEDAIVAANLPTIVVGLRDRKLRADSPLQHASEITSDSSKIAELAAEHLLERHFRNYAYVGFANCGYSDERGEAFCACIRRAGHEPLVYKPPTKGKERAWEVEYANLAEWLRKLEKPVGLMACNDDRGREVLDACQIANLIVPEEVSVVGVDNDELFCELADPPLSSVAFEGERGGYQAAELLDQLMCGKVKGPRKIIIEPLNVATRRSTDSVALADRDVAAAVSFIRQTNGCGITVGDVVNYVALSRRNLEVRFLSMTGRTLNGEIQRIRLANAKRLLVETEYSIPRVAEIAGYSSASYLIQVFRKRLKMTPAKYRAAHHI